MVNKDHKHKTHKMIDTVTKVLKYISAAKLLLVRFTDYTPCSYFSKFNNILTKS